MSSREVDKAEREARWAKMDMESRDKALGALVGAAIGDALGAPLEFLPPRGEQDYVKDMVGGGALRWKKGEYTDDTKMSLAVSEMYLKYNKYCQRDLVERWLKWGASGPKDIGNWTNGALRNWTRVVNAIDYDSELRDDQHPVIQMWQRRGEKDAGNGGVMRCMPTALFVNDRDRRIKDTVKICQDTHPDPRCILSCVAVVEAIHMMIHTSWRYSDVTHKESIRAQVVPGYQPESRFMAYVMSVVGPGDVYNALEEAQYCPIDQCMNSGYTVDTVKCAFAALNQAEDFESGLIAIVNRGNDADTVGSIAGALMGAHFGLKAIPQRWKDQLMDYDKIVQIADELHTRGSLNEQAERERRNEEWNKKKGIAE